MPLSKEELVRVARQLNVLSQDQQLALHQGRVLVVGAGGLGCPIMQSLAAAGVGHIRLVDDDTVELSNIHRQTLFGAADVGRPKAEVAATRLAALQPGIEVDAQQRRLTPETVLDLLDGVDLVLDGSDTFATKYLVGDACELTGTPLVWGTVLRFSGQVALWHSGPSVTDGVGLRDLFPEQPGADFAPDCATAGVLGVTTAVVGNLMATEAIKYLAGLSAEPGRVLSYDALGASLGSLRVRRDPARHLVCALADSYGAACAAPGAAGLLSEVRAGRALALDIREPHEVLASDLDIESVKLPLSAATDQAVREAVGDHTHVVVYCQSGRRSAAFTERTHLDGVEFQSLPGGVIAQTRHS